MRKVVLDAETFFSTQYSLRKMTPPEYILGSEYETIGWGVKIDNRPPVWLEGDMVARMATQPHFAVDLPLLEEHLSDVQAAKATLLGRAGVTKMQLMSGEHFATCLRALGVEPETKPSPTDPAKQTYAFAKSDTF